MGAKADGCKAFFVCSAAHCFDVISAVAKNGVGVEGAEDVVHVIYNGNVIPRGKPRGLNNRHE
jgi:hypothetical protein